MNSTRKTINITICGITLIASSAFAQDVSTSVTDVQNGTFIEATQKWYESDSLFLTSTTGGLTGKTGFAPFAVWTGEVWGNITNGSNIDNMVDSLFTVGFEQDLSVVAKTNGLGRIGVSAFYYTQSHGGSLGNLDSSQGCWSNIVAGDMARVFEIYYANEFETKFGDIAIRVGQLASDEDFMGMDYSDTFLNSSFGALPNVAPAQLFSQYNVATLGMVVYYTYDNFDAMLGVYNGNVGQDISSNNGFDYLNTFDTVSIWYQLGYNYKIGELDGRIIFGGNYHSSPDKINFDQIDTNSFYSFYFGIQQVLLNDAGGNAKFGIFARVGWVPDSKSSEQNFYADFGFNWFAPIPTRVDDVFAIAFRLLKTNVSHELNTHITKAHLKQHINSKSHRLFHFNPICRFI